MDSSFGLGTTESEGVAGTKDKETGTLQHESCVYAANQYRTAAITLVCMLFPASWINLSLSRGGSPAAIRLTLYEHIGAYDLLPATDSIKTS